MPEKSPHNAAPGGPPDDLTLMRAIGARDSSSLALLYDRYGAAVLGLCLRIVGSRAEAEEVLIDVFFQVWEQASQYEPSRGNPAAYVLTIARSRAIDRVRALGRRARVEGPAENLEASRGEGSGSSEESTSTFRDAWLSEQRARIEAALARLDPGQRRVVEMSFFDDLSHSEIAEKLGEPLGTVKTRIRQGLIRLRESLGAQFGREAIP